MNQALASLALLFAAPLAAEAQAQVRIPAEWEQQEAVWMQWPRWYEASYRPEFAEIIRAAQNYQPVHIVVHSSGLRNHARNYLQNRNVPLNQVEFIIMKTDNAWMRDNGPVWAEHQGRTFVQDWGFDGWGGDAGPYYKNDDAIPPQVASLVGVPSYDLNDFIHERGNLEFNGSDTVILNWDCWNARNPQLSQTASTNGLKRAFGVQRVVWVYGTSPSDITEGHIDGMVRFINETTVVVPQYQNANHPDAQLYDDAANECLAAGLQVRRMNVPGDVMYRGVPMSAVYVNWLVLNGAVIMPGFGNAAWDAAAKAEVESYFPGRQVHVVQTLELWYFGGSVHCVTNDQPVVR